MTFSYHWLLLLECQHLFLAFSSLLYSQLWWSSLVSDLKALNTIYRLPTLKLIHSTQTSHLNSRLTYLTDCFTDQFGCPIDSRLKLSSWFHTTPKSVLPIAFLISVERTFILLVSTWAKIPMFSATPSLKPHKASQSLSKSKHWGFYLQNSVNHPLVPYRHHHPFGLNVATIIFTRTVARASWLVFHVLPHTVDSQTRNQVTVLKCKLDNQSSTESLPLWGSLHNGREAQQCRPCHFFEPISSTFPLLP